MDKRKKQECIEIIYVFKSLLNIFLKSHLRQNFLQQKKSVQMNFNLCFYFALL